MIQDFNDAAAMILGPVMVLLGITAYAMACSRYPRRPRKGGRR